MKKIFIVFCFILLVIVVILTLSIFKKQPAVLHNSTKASNLITASPSTTIQQRFLFVPYWTLGNSIDGNYQSIIYFGLTPTTKGIDKQDDGYKNIGLFLSLVPSQSKKLLAVQFLDSTLSEKVLSDTSLQQKIIQDSDSIAKENGFNGIVLDLEYNALAFDSVVNSITHFSNSFAKDTKSHGMLFYQTLYGDTFYRGRPYDIKKIASSVDGVLVMAYDFHKANGDPGPNFPLQSKEEGYDFTQMVDDFENQVDRRKLIIVFGMFGYDWTVDNKGLSTKMAKSLSDNEITERFLSSCKEKDCNITTDSKSLEEKITYTDTVGDSHIVWFENMDSVSKKKELLQQKGISSIGFWANGYF